MLKSNLFKTPPKNWKESKKLLMKNISLWFTIEIYSGNFHHYFSIKTKMKLRKKKLC